MAAHPLLVLSACVAGWAVHRYGSPGWASVGVLPGAFWYGTGLAWRRVNPTSALHALPTSVYGFPFADGRKGFVYIGITVTGRELTRWGEHDEKWWRSRAAAPMVLARYPDRYKASTREALLIRRYRPVGNTMHNRLSGWRALFSIRYVLRLGEFRDARRRRDAREAVAVLSLRYRCELRVCEWVAGWRGSGFGFVPGTPLT